MYKKKYSLKAFSELIKTDALHDVTYVVEGFVFVSDGKTFERMNKKPLSLDRLVEFEELAKENSRPLMEVWLGDDRHVRVKEYLDFVAKK